MYLAFNHKRLCATVKTLFFDYPMINNSILGASHNARTALIIVLIKIDYSVLRKWNLARQKAYTNFADVSNSDGMPFL